MTKSNLQEIIEKLQHIMEPTRVLVQEPLSKHTTFKIGGPADYLVIPSTIGEVAGVIKLAGEYNIPVIVLGNGSNVLVLDKGIKGIVIKFNSEMSYIRHSEAMIVAGAGCLLADVSRYAAHLNLSGMEFAVGIPGSIGGAVFMNAGAYSGEMGQVVSAVSAVTPTGSIKRFEQHELGFNYRHSIFQDNQCVICEVELSLQFAEKVKIREKMDDYTYRRESKQPLEMPSAGSTFKRPLGHFAGTLIEEAGLKGLKVGGAQVSVKHAGFVINAGDATAEDVLNLIKEVQHRVYKHSGVMLQPEVRILGQE